MPLLWACAVPPTPPAASWRRLVATSPSPSHRPNCNNGCSPYSKNYTTSNFLLITIRKGRIRMQRKDLNPDNNDEPTITVSKPAGRQPVPRNKSSNSSHIVTADSVQAEEVPTIPLSSLQTLSALEPEVAVRSVTTTDSVHLPPPLVVQPSEYQRDLGEWLQFWWEGIRPTYVLLAILPVLLGTLLAWVQTLSSKTPCGLFHWEHFLGTLVVVIALQTGANLVNDYY